MESELKVGMGNECLMFSGGMDSLIAACYLGIERLVYVRLGHRYQFWEERVVKQLGDLLGIWVEIENGPSLTAWEQPSAFIPARNLILALRGAYDHDRVWLALQKGETDLWDRSKDFCMETSRILSAHFAPREIWVDSPFWDTDKQEMVAWYVAQGRP